MPPHNYIVNIGKYIEYFMSHNQLVFGITLAVIFALCCFLLYRLFFYQEAQTSNAHAASSADVGQIEETLKKILSQTATIAPTSPGALPPEVEKLKADLEVSQKMVDELKVRAQDSGTDNTPELLAKIKILEDRLTEYEIIEDDIADLSVYKEENAKLKRQLEAIKAGTSSPMVEDFAAAVENAPVGTEVRGESVEEAVAAAEAISESVPEPTDALDRAVEPIVEPVAKSAPVSAPAPVAAAEPAPTVVSSDENVPGTTDVFAEFQGDENKDILSELGDIDADRMLEEIKDLGDGMQADANVLDEEVDLEKMAKETTKG